MISVWSGTEYVNVQVNVGSIKQIKDGGVFFNLDKGEALRLSKRLREASGEIEDAPIPAPTIESEIYFIKQRMATLESYVRRLDGLPKR